MKKKVAYSAGLLDEAGDGVNAIKDNQNFLKVTPR